MIHFCKLKIYFIFFISTILFSGCFSVKPVIIGKVQDINLDNFLTNELFFSFKTNVKNPNNFKIKVTEVKLKASLDNIDIGKVTKVSRVTIPPNSDQLYEVKITIQLSENYSNISDLIQLSMRSSSIKFAGYIKVRTFLFSKKIPVEDKNIPKLLNY